MANTKQTQSSKCATKQQPLLPSLDMRNENIKAVTGKIEMEFMARDD